MVDVVDRVTRSRMMAGIRAKNTRPEIAIRHALHRLGFRYRLHPSDMPGKPDLVLPKHGAVIFVNGCFWHGHDCSLFKLPTTRRDFWKTKMRRNRARDRKVVIELGKLGWRCLTIWECAFRGPFMIGLDRAIRYASAWIVSRSRSKGIRGKA